MSALDQGKTFDELGDLSVQDRCELGLLCVHDLGERVTLDLGEQIAPIWARKKFSATKIRLTLSDQIQVRIKETRAESACVINFFIICNLDDIRSRSPPKRGMAKMKIRA